MIYICNSFTLAMLPQWRRCVESTLRVTPVARPDQFLDAFPPEEIVSAVGHADTAALFANLLGRDVPANRASVTLHDEDVLLVGQYIGPRLPEGTTTLPDGATVTWFAVRVFENAHPIRQNGVWFSDEVSLLALA